MNLKEMAMMRFKRNLLSSLVVMSFFLANCTPTLLNVKEDSDIVPQIPAEYPKTEGGAILPEDIEPAPKDSSGAEVPFAGTPPAEAPAAGAPIAEAPAPKVPTPEVPPVSIEENWKTFFIDENLSSLIATALKSNQELNIATQEISISNNEVLARTGEYLPKLGIGGDAGLEKRGKYTSQGVSDATDEYEPGKPVPEKLPMYSLGLKMSWEVDIWKKLRNAKKSAVLRYLASIDGRNYMVTRLIAEVSNTYYELLALDKQLEVVNNNIAIQTEALELVRLQKEAARVTSLAVRRFEAEVYKNRSRQFELRQEIIQTENRLNYLLGRLPQPIPRGTTDFISRIPKNIKAGVPSQLLSLRPDVKQAERKLAAAKLDVKVAKARFYPSLSIEAGAGYESFNSKHLFQSPESIFYNIAGNLSAPLLNRMGIKAAYLSANAMQIQAVYDYEKTIIKAYTEVVNQLSMIDNMQKRFALKSKQVAALNDAVEVSNMLFKAARADYVEVLMTRRDALDAQIELVEIKKKQLTSFVNLYQSLGGGWTE
jgi:outer membrane protein, multidrug efflux system